MARSDQLALLNEALRHARSSVFYRDRLPQAPLRAAAELGRIPFTTRADLRALPPHGLVCVERRELLQYHESSATTGAPVSVWYSRRDLAEIHERLAGWGVGLTADDRVLVRFPYALSTIGHFVHAAAQTRGACVIPADSRSTITPLVRVVDLMRRLEVTVLATMSLSAVMIAESAELAGLDPSRDFPHLRAIVCAGEPVSPHRRELVERLFGVPLFDNYGMTETGPLAMDCHARRMHPFQDQFFMEVLDDRLEREVAPGETGHLVVTSLTRRASPLVRYVTGDRVKRASTPCKCGDGTTIEVRGRAEDTMWIGGQRLDLWTLSAIVARLPGQRFWRVTPVPAGLRFVIERERDDDRVRPGLLAELERDHGLQIEVILVPKGTLYDRTEPVSFGMTGKPVYIEAPRPTARAPFIEHRREEQS